MNWIVSVYNSLNTGFQFLLRICHILCICISAMFSFKIKLYMQGLLGAGHFNFFVQIQNKIYIAKSTILYFNWILINQKSNSNNREKWQRGSQLQVNLPTCETKFFRRNFSFHIACFCILGRHNISALS